MKRRVETYSHVHIGPGNDVIKGQSVCGMSEWSPRTVKISYTIKTKTKQTKPLISLDNW